TFFQPHSPSGCIWRCVSIAAAQPKSETATLTTNVLLVEMVIRRLNRAMHKIIATLVLLLCALPTLRAAEDAKPLRALLVCGGCCHDYEHQKHILGDGISARANVEFTIVHEGTDRTNRV